MIQVELSQEFQVPAREAFAYITNVANFGTFFPGFVRIGNPGEARWQAVGDKVTIVARVLNVERDLNMTLLDVRPGERVRFSMQQSGLPVIEQERIFSDTPSGSHCRQVASYEPRTGLAGLFDRFVVRRVLARGFARAASALRESMPAPAA